MYHVRKKQHIPRQDLKAQSEVDDLFFVASVFGGSIGAFSYVK